MSRGVARVHTRLGDGSATAPGNLQLVSSTYFAVLGAAGHRPRPSGQHGSGPREQPGRRHQPRLLATPLRRRERRRRPDADHQRHPFTIIGVGPPDFTGVWLELPVDIWVPLTAQPP